MQITEKKSGCFGRFRFERSLTFVLLFDQLFLPKNMHLAEPRSFRLSTSTLSVRSPLFNQHLASLSNGTPRKKVISAMAAERMILSAHIATQKCYAKMLAKRNLSCCAANANYKLQFMLNFATSRFSASSSRVSMAVRQARSSSLFLRSSSSDASASPARSGHDFCELLAFVSAAACDERVLAGVAGGREI